MDWIGWIPDLRVLDLWVWGLLVAPVVVAGVPLLLATVRVPRTLELEEVADSDLDPTQRSWFDGIGQQLRTLGYETGVTFRAPNLPGENLSRAWVGGMDGSVAVALALKDERGHSVLSENLVEFNTEFSDGSFVNTRSTAVTDLFDLPAGYARHIHPTRSPRTLKQLHERHCQRQKVAAVPVQASELLARMGDFHRRWIAHQLDRGLLRVVDDEWCGATVRLALRGIRSFFNPFGDRFSPLRLLVGLAAGLTAPLLVAIALSLPSLSLVPQVQSVIPVSSHLAEVLTLAPALLLAAAAVGWIFESRAVVWAPLLASGVGWLALPASSPDAFARAAWLGVLLATPVLANGVSNLRHRRQALV
jgi:hypothetical protein